MIASLTERATARVARFRKHIDRTLDGGDSRKALHQAVRALEAEAAAFLRERRSTGQAGDGEIAYAELAGMLLANAALLHLHNPQRPAGCPALPRPEDLHTVFAASFDGALSAAEDAARTGAGL